MNIAPPLPVSDRLSLTLDGLCRAVAARIAGGAMAAAMIVLVWTRVKRAEVRIKVLLARFLAGRLRERAPAVRHAARTGRPARPEAVAKAQLPRRFGWLLPMVPYEAANFASQLRGMLEEPEMVALLGASAQARRVLSPLCRMLGVEAVLLRAPVKGVAAPETCDEHQCFDDPGAERAVEADGLVQRVIADGEGAEDEACWAGGARASPSG